MPAIYSDPEMELIRVLYRVEDGTWSARSPDLPGWLAVADTYEECRRFAEEGIPWALERTDIQLEHFVPAPA